MGKNQLHQLLAVEQDRRGRATEIIAETVNLYQRKDEHLDGIVKVYSPLEEGGDTLPNEVKEIVTTVADKMQYAAPFIVKAIDAQLSKEETNATGTARADLEVDGTSFGSLSATALLALEQHLQRLLGLYRVIPTLDPVRQWNKDTGLENVYVSEMDVKFRTNKIETHEIAAQATKEFPAQVVKVVKDVQVGKWETLYKSGKITPLQKSTLLSRIDQLLDAVKRARAKANQAEVVQMKVGESLLGFINEGIL